MRIEGIRNRTELLGRFRQAKKPQELISIRPTQLSEFEAAGWQVSNVGKTKIRVQRERPLSDSVELQAWRVMYLSGFPFLSSDGGAKLTRGQGVENQLDVVAYDDNAAMVIECKSSEGGVCNVDVQAELAVLNDLRNAVRQVLNAERSRDDKLKVGGILVLFNVPFTDSDRRRASEMNLTIFDSSVLNYYERLATIIGSATRFQLFGEVFRGQDIPSLTLRVPAVEFSMGESKAFSFALSPTNLLKISFVAHRDWSPKN